MIREPGTSIVTVMYCRWGEVGSVWIWEPFPVKITIIFCVICNVFHLMYSVQNFLATRSKRHQVKGRHKRKIYWLFISVTGVLTAKEYLCVVIKPTLQSIWTIRTFLIDAVLPRRPSGSISFDCCRYVVLYAEIPFDITRDAAFEL